MEVMSASRYKDSYPAACHHTLRFFLILLYFQMCKPPPAGKAQQSQIYLSFVEPLWLLAITCGQDAYFNLPLFSSAGRLDDRKFVLVLCCNHLKRERNDEEL